MKLKAIDLKKYGINDLSFYLAIEEYLINQNSSDDYFFLWNIDKSIIIGKNQVLENELNLAEIDKIGAKIYRRPSGGGAIFADLGCFMYTFITKANEKEIIIKEKLTLILDCLRSLGLNVSFCGRNDLIFNDKKFSGTSLYYKNNKVALHGTFLYDTNLADLERVLYSNKQKLETKGIQSVRSRVINLKDYLNLTKDELMDYLINYISSNNLVELNEKDYSEINKIKEKYDSKEYILGLNPKFSIKRSHYFKFGYLEVHINVNKNKIESFKLLGDFFFKLDISQYEAYFLGLDYDKELIINKINEFDIGKYIIDCENSDIINLIFNDSII